MSSDSLNFLGTPLVHDGPGVSIVDIGVTWTFTFIAIVFVSLRFYLRAKFAGGISYDDWLMLASLVLLIACSACTTKSNLHGLGRSFESLTLEDYKISNYWFFLVGPLNCFISPLARTAIAVLLNRIFGQSKPWFRKYLIGWTIFMIIGSILSFSTYMARLTPIQAQWDPTIEYRVNLNALVEEYIALGVEYQMIISDITYVFFPVAFIWKLNMPWQRKFGLVVLMSVGLITFAAGLARIIVATEIVRSTFYATQNAGVLIGLLATVENSLAISMGCVPTLGHINMLQFTIFSRIGESLASLLPKTLRGSRRNKSSEDSSKSLGVPDVELGGVKYRISDEGTIPLTGTKGGHTGFVLATQEQPSGKSAENIMRTDDYMISYENRPKGGPNRW